MNLSCDIVMDLMGLCCDGTASEDTKAVVKAHIATCTKCKAIFEGYRATPPAPQEILMESEMDFSLLARRMRTRRLWLFAGMLSYISVSIGAVAVLWAKRERL